MKNFIKNILSSCFGAMAALIIVCGILFIVAMGMISFFSDMSNFKSPAAVSGEEVLYIDLPVNTPELTNNTEPVKFEISDKAQVGIQDIIRLIKKAKLDDDVQGIILNPATAGISYATVDLLRDALIDFKSMGKFIYVYAEGMSQKSYYFTSVADSIFLNPNGGISFTGMGLMTMYFKNTLDKLGIEPEIYYVGDFKSATEPLRRTDMSDADRLQKKQYLDAIFSEMIDDIAQSRNLNPDTLEYISDNALIRSAEDALKWGLVDNLSYYSDFINKVKARIGMEKNTKFMPYNINSYYNKYNKKLTPSPSNADEIAIVYAEGSIIDGKPAIGKIADSKYVKLLRKLRFDDDVRGVILRVNSPGGSALASDNIWHEIEKLKAAGKKVIVSMGTYAASGGYYISCNADYIFAEPTTLTGSIGVFGVLFNANDFFNNKLGITFDTVQTGKFTNSFTPFMGRDKQEAEIIQSSVNEIYQQFMSRVAEGRDIPIDSVAEIAQGRVYTGKKALSLGLVDEIGSLQDAINKMVVILDIDVYDIDEYPEVSSPLEQLIKEITGENGAKKITLSALPTEYTTILNQLENIQEMEGVQARLPFMVVK